MFYVFVAVVVVLELQSRKVWGAGRQERKTKKVKKGTKTDLKHQVKSRRHLCVTHAKSSALNFITEHCISRLYM